MRLNLVTVAALASSYASITSAVELTCPTSDPYVLDSGHALGTGNASGSYADQNAVRNASKNVAWQDVMTKLANLSDFCTNILHATATNYDSTATANAVCTANPNTDYSSCTAQVSVPYICCTATPPATTTPPGMPPPTMPPPTTTTTTPTTQGTTIPMTPPPSNYTVTAHGQGAKEVWKVWYNEYGNGGVFNHPDSCDQTEARADADLTVDKARLEAECKAFIATLTGITLNPAITWNDDKVIVPCTYTVQTSPPTGMASSPFSWANYTSSAKQTGYCGLTP